MFEVITALSPDKDICQCKGCDCKFLLSVCDDEGERLSVCGLFTQTLKTCSHLSLRCQKCRDAEKEAIK